MKILFIGDPHLKITRFDLAKQFIAWIDEVVVRFKPDLVVNLGDTFDTHAVVRSEIMTEFMGHVDRCLLVAPYIYVLGNHDMYKPNDSKYHALSHIKGKVKDFYVVDSPQDISGITFVPYMHDPLMFPTKTLPICVAHQTFKGADYGNITTKDGVDLDCLSNCQLVVSGHIHKRQKFSSSKGVEVRYVGSPFSQSASDVNQVKGVSLIETDTLEETFIECPLPAWRGLRYEITPSFSPDDLHRELASHINDRDHWVVEIYGPKAEIVGYLGSDEARGILSGKDVKIKTVFTDKEKKNVRIEAISVDRIISEYIDKVYSGSIDREALKKAVSDIMSKI